MKALPRSSLLLALLTVFGCGTMSNGRRWGQDATLLPGWQRVGQAAKDAFTDPKFLVPAAGLLAAEIVIEGAEHDLWSVNADYASYHEEAVITDRGLSEAA